MKIVTIGSRVCDDAIHMQKCEIDNECRIVGVSPFAFCTGEMSTLSLDGVSNDYRMKMLGFEMIKDCTVKSGACEYAVIDFLCASLKISELLFSNGKTVRCTYNHFYVEHENEIICQAEKAFSTKLHTKRILNPLEWTNEVLRKEMQSFADKLSRIGKVVLIENKIPFQHLDSNGEIVNRANYQEIADLNGFYQKCCALICEMLDCIVIAKVQNALGIGEQIAGDSLKYTEEYYKYITQSLQLIKQKKERNSILKDYERNFQNRALSLCLEEPDILLKKFTGEYTDCYGNQIVSTSGNEYHLKGMGVRIEDYSCKESVLYVEAFHGARLYIGRNVRTDKLSLILYTEGEIRIEENATFADNCKMYADSSFKIQIGRDCMFSSKVVIGTSISTETFDSELESPVSRLHRKSSMKKGSVVLGEHVWVGYQVVLLCGTDIKNGSIIGARSIVTGEFPNNCIIAGNPAAVKKRDIHWERDPFALKIQSLEYANRTIGRKE